MKSQKRIWKTYLKQNADLDSQTIFLKYFLEIRKDFHEKKGQRVLIDKANYSMFFILHKLENNYLQATHSHTKAFFLLSVS